jgi:hypothetical protein
MLPTIHLLLIPINPEDVPRFVGYIKQELAHLVNKRRGERKHTIWCEGYDSPVILDQHELAKRTAYIYTQGQSNHRAETIQEYVGINSWQIYDSKVDTATIKAPRWSRTKPLEKQLLETVVIEPNCWRQCYKDTPIDEYRHNTKEWILFFEQTAREERVKLGIPILTSKPTAEQERYYKPKNFGRRMICLGTYIETRRAHTSWYKGMRNLCKEIYQGYLAGTRSLEELPPGFFPPAAKRIARSCL